MWEHHTSRTKGKLVFDLMYKVVRVPVAVCASCRSIMVMVLENMLLNLVVGPPMEAS